MFVTDAERSFLAVVQAQAPDVGYGRMMQIISHAWWRMDPVGAFTEGLPFGLLDGDDAAHAAAAARHDLLFQPRLMQDAITARFREQYERDRAALTGLEYRKLTEGTWRNE